MLNRIGFTNVVQGSGGHRNELDTFSFLGAANMLVGFCQLIKKWSLDYFIALIFP